ncbi:hypothetical protein QOM18_25850 [Serratia marcescens]|uniref:hypothetical protein n=1 Tax=Serratia marcescens TaxID=615 RepID=UPI0024C47F59|nr:hypothetical protein [Serratia marcescens]MDK1711742.1 hypothetical protein [Serratia marcescens]
MKNINHSAILRRAQLCLPALLLAVCTCSNAAIIHGTHNTATTTIEVIANANAQPFTLTAGESFQAGKPYDDGTTVAVFTTQGMTEGAVALALDGHDTGHPDTVTLKGAYSEGHTLKLKVDGSLHITHDSDWILTDHLYVGDEFSAGIVMNGEQTVPSDLYTLVVRAGLWAS